MADIAILVAEEYERRIKLARKTGDPSMEMGSISMLNPVHRFSNKWITKTRFQIDDKVFHATSPVAIAALDGFFSA